MTQSNESKWKILRNFKEEIRMMVSVGSEKGVIDQDENEMIQNVLDFNDVYVEEICTHRKDVVSLDMDESLEEWREIIRTSRHNYMPVYGKDTDDIVGVFDTRAFLRMEGNCDGLTQKEVLDHCLRKAYFVPENMKADTLCKNMKTSGVHFAVAIDEYGGMSGIVTMHDLIELIIGELFEEGENQEPDDIEKLEENCWRIQGSADLEDVAELLELHLPVDEYDTFGGYVFGVLGRIPDEGDSFCMETDDLDIRVENVQAHRMESAIVSKKKTPLEGTDI